VNISVFKYTRDWKVIHFLYTFKVKKLISEFLLKSEVILTK